MTDDQKRAAWAEIRAFLQPEQSGPSVPDQRGIHPETSEAGKQAASAHYAGAALDKPVALITENEKAHIRYNVLKVLQENQ